MSIQLANSHLCLKQSLVHSLFQEESLALMSYQPSKNQLLMAPSTSSWFSKMHQAEQCLLKTKNIQGDKSIAIHSLLIDHEIDASDRMLSYELNETAGWLKIDLNA